MLSNDLFGEIILGTVLALFCLCIPWGRMSPRKLTLAKVWGVVTDRQFLLLLAFFGVVSLSFLHAKHRAEQRALRGLQLQRYVAKLSAQNGDFRNLRTAQDISGLRLYGDVRSDDELQVLRRYVMSTFGLDDGQADQMIHVHVTPVAEAK